MFGVSITEPLERGLARFFEYLPQLIGALLILFIGYLIAKTLQKVVQRSLHRLRFDRSLSNSSIGEYLSHLVKSPSVVMGKIAFWLVFLAFFSFSLAALDLPVLDRIVSGIYSYVPNIVAAIGIFLIAGAVSAGAASFVLASMGKTPTARLISTVIPGITMSIAVFMILDQLNIAENIVNITFTAIMGSLALGLALAFGLGGRDVARQILEEAYRASQNNKEEIKRDVNRAKSRGREKVQQALEDQ